jgi:hypothetical protein
MRPSHFLILTLLLLALLDTVLYVDLTQLRGKQAAAMDLLATTTAGLGLSDLCVATEARYTRHPAASDPVVPFMDHPGGLEHFPTGSFWAPPAGAGRGHEKNQ